MEIVIMGLLGCVILWIVVKSMIGNPPKTADGEELSDPVVRHIATAINRKVAHDGFYLDRYVGGPPETLTLIADIDYFANARPMRGLWQHEGLYEERAIQARWRRRAPSRRMWDAVRLVVPVVVNAAFETSAGIQTVRFHIGNMDMNNDVATCRVSVEAERGEREDEWDWRYNRNAKGQLAPVNPHEDAPAPVRPRGFAADPYDFEMQVAQALQARGLSVEVTGGAGDEGVDIIARDPTPVTGGTYLVQCKRYTPDRACGASKPQ